MLLGNERNELERGIVHRHIPSKLSIPFLLDSSSLTDIVLAAAFLSLYKEYGLLDPTIIPSFGS